MVGLPGPRLTPDNQQRLRALNPAGVILFDRNLDSPDQTAHLLDGVRGLLSGPACLALDQEGGRVSRLRRWIGNTPTAAELARSDGRSVRRFARVTARGLRSLGFNVDFAPVVDLCAPDAPNGIGDRSYGTDPEHVAAMAGEFLLGLREGGVAGCLKHFPGLGDSAVDSHVELPTVSRSVEQLEREDLLPFQRLGDRTDAIMVGHGYYPALDPDRPLPATCSANVIEGLLRSRLGYTGLVVSDDLEMGAVSSLDHHGMAAVRAIAAGCDLLLYCADLARAERAARALEQAADRDPAVRRRLEQAIGRVNATAESWSVSTPDLVAWESARADLTKFG
jgi:beta-N-acetylhexosaminidase